MLVLLGGYFGGGGRVALGRPRGRGRECGRRCWVGARAWCGGQVSVATGLTRVEVEGRSRGWWSLSPCRVVVRCQTFGWQGRTCLNGRKGMAIGNCETTSASLRSDSESQAASARGLCAAAALAESGRNEGPRLRFRCLFSCERDLAVVGLLVEQRIGSGRPPAEPPRVCLECLGLWECARSMCFFTPLARTVLLLLSDAQGRPFATYFPPKYLVCSRASQVSLLHTAVAWAVYTHSTRQQLLRRVLHALPPPSTAELSPCGRCWRKYSPVDKSATPVSSFFCFHHHTPALHTRVLGPEHKGTLLA